MTLVKHKSLASLQRVVCGESATAVDSAFLFFSSLFFFFFLPFFFSRIWSIAISWKLKKDGTGMFIGIGTGNGTSNSTGNGSSTGIDFFLHQAADWFQLPIFSHRSDAFDMLQSSPRNLAMPLTKAIDQCHSSAQLTITTDKRNWPMPLTNADQWQKNWIIPPTNTI